MILVTRNICQIEMFPFISIKREAYGEMALEYDSRSDRGIRFWSQSPRVGGNRRSFLGAEAVNTEKTEIEGAEVTDVSFLILNHGKLSLTHDL